MHGDSGFDGISIRQEADIFLPAAFRELRKGVCNRFRVRFGRHEIETVVFRLAELIHNVVVRGIIFEDHILDILKGLAVPDGEETVQLRRAAEEFREPAGLLFSELGAAPGPGDQRPILLAERYVQNDGTGDFPVGIKLPDFHRVEQALKLTPFFGSGQFNAGIFERPDCSLLFRNSGKRNREEQHESCQQGNDFSHVSDLLSE